LGIVLSMPLLGAEVIHFIALAHFVGWYRHADRMLRSRPRREVAGGNLLAWVRNTAAGFRTLHLGLAGLFVVLFMVSAYGSANHALLNTLVGPEAFPYWTIVHITVSFSPR